MRRLYAGVMPSRQAKVITMSHIDSRSSVVGGGILAAAVFASPAHAQFVFVTGTGHVETYVDVSAAGYFDVDAGFQELVFPGPIAGWASSDVVAGGTTVSADSRLSASVAPHIVSCHHLNKRVAAWGDLMWGFFSLSKADFSLKFNLTQANTNVLVIAHGKAVHAGSGGLPGSVGTIKGTLALGRFGDALIINDSYNLSAPGTASHAYVAHAVLPTGLYNIALTSLTNGDPMTGEVELAVDLIAGCSTQEVSYVFPAKGAPIQVTLDVGGTQVTKVVAVTGSLTGTVVMDCTNHPAALQLESIHLEPIDNPVVWDLPLGMSLVASSISMDADGTLGALGSPAPIANNCCGTLVGVSPVISGSAVLTAADGATYPMSFNNLFEPSFAGIPFTLGGLSDASTLALDLGFSGTIDLGFGKGNPTIISSGTVTASGFTCPHGDLDCDLVVGSSDLAILLGNWSSGPDQPGCGGGVPCPADLDFDGVVGPADLAIVLGAWSPG